MHASRRTAYLWIETGVVLLTCVLPLIFVSEFDVLGMGGRPEPLPFVYQALRYIVEYTGQIALVLFIIWRSNDPPGKFGLRPFKIGRDLFGGALICALLRGTYHLLWFGLRIVLSRNDYWELAHTGTGLSYHHPSGAPQFALLAVMCLLSGFTQELVMRAYLITRFEELFESTGMAIFLSTLLFTFYHGYQGLAGVIYVILSGTIQAILFGLFRRLAPLALGHALNNFIAIGQITWL